MKTLNTAFDRILVISLPLSHRRREHIRANFKEAEISNYEFLDAIDGRVLPIEGWQDSGCLLPRQRSGFHLTPGQVGCALSHAFAYALMLSRRYRNVLICEDDVVFSKECHEMVESYMNRMPSDWDIIHFYSSRSDEHPSSQQRQRVAENIYEGFSEGGGAACYAVTPRCARYLLSIRFPMNKTADGIVNWPTGPWTTGYRGYVVKPFLCKRTGTARFPSEIGPRPKL